MAKRGQNEQNTGGGGNMTCFVLFHIYSISNIYEYDEDMAIIETIGL